MIIYALAGHSPEYHEFVEKLGSFLEISFIEDEDAFLLSFNECDVAILDLTELNSKTKKLIKKVSKMSESVKLWPVCLEASRKDVDRLVEKNFFKYDQLFNIEMSASDIQKKLQKTVVAKKMSDDTRTLALQVLENHSEVELSEKALGISEKLDSLFSMVFFEQYSDRKVKVKSTEGDIVSDSEDKDLDIGGLELGDDDLELNIGDDLDESDEEMTQVGLDLDLEESVELNVESNQAEDNNTATRDINELDIDFSAEDVAVKEEKTVTDLAFNVAEGTGEEEDKDFALGSFDIGDDDGDNEDQISTIEEAIEDEVVIETKENDEDDLGFDLSLSESNSDELTRPLQGVTSQMESSSKEEPTEPSPADEIDLFDGEEDLSPLDDLKTKILEIDAILAQDNGPDEKALDDETLEEDSSNELTEENMEEFHFSNEDDEPLQEWSPASSPDDDSDKTEQWGTGPNNTTMESTRTSQVNIGVDGHEFQHYKQNHSEELVRLSETIKSLRIDREHLLAKVDTLENTLDSQKNNHLSIQAALDEKKIEVEIIKKRFQKKVDDLSIKLELIENRKDILEEQNRIYSGELLSLQKEKKINVSKIRLRERELEEKLELLRKDSEVQIKNRDLKILDLKRKIDSLEFDIESAYSKEKQSMAKQHVVEEKMNKVIRTLRTVIGQVEEDSILDERKKMIKKNMDV